MKLLKNIVILGAGSIGTAIGNILSTKNELNVNIITVEEEIAKSIENEHLNHIFFPNIRLNPKLKATISNEPLKNADVIIIAIPSIAVMEYLRSIKNYIPKNALLINIAKGFGENLKTIPECIENEFENTTVIPMKGPSFAREIINNVPTAFTIASCKSDILDDIEEIFKGTSLFTDRTTDVLGVELLSILKNIYAIIIGIVDAQFDSANMRFLVFTKAFNEMRYILLKLGGKKKTMFNYCGIGDFGLTSLNDLSRNRTLGLFIGKSFFDEGISNKVVLEGQIAMKNMLVKLNELEISNENYPLMYSLNKVFAKEISVQEFVNTIIKL